MGIRLGTTPKHTITIDLDTSLIQKLKITYAQKDKVILTKYKDDCVLSGNVVTVQLTQEDTFLFNKQELIQIQMRVRKTDGNVLGTDVKTVSPKVCLDDEVL